MQENGNPGKQVIGSLTVVSYADGSVEPKFDGNVNVPLTVFVLENIKIDLIMRVKQQQMMQAMQGVQQASGPLPPFRK